MARESLLNCKFGPLVCIEDTNYREVQCKCLECGMIQTRSRSHLIRVQKGEFSAEKIICKNVSCKLHARKYQYVVGDKIGEYKIVRMEGNTVDVICESCGHRLTSNIKLLIYNSNCRNNKCIHSRYKQGIGGRYKYKIGEKVNGLRILEVSSNECKNHTGNYLVQCLECGTKFYLKQPYIKETTNHCVNVNCRNYRGRSGSEYLVGKIRYELKCIGYEGSGIRLKCLGCGEEFVLSSPSDFTRSHVHCRNTKCKNCLTYDYTGEVIGKVKVLKKLGNKKLLVECIKCGTTFEIYQNTIKMGYNSCPNRNCEYNAYYNKVFNKVYGDYKLLEISDDAYVYKCIVCGNVIKLKSTISSGYRYCSMHPRKPRYKDKDYFGFFVLNYEFTYKGLDYFTCQCKKCGKKDILNVKQMLEHSC